MNSFEWFRVVLSGLSGLSGYKWFRVVIEWFEWLSSSYG